MSVEPEPGPLNIRGTDLRHHRAITLRWPTPRPAGWRNWLRMAWGTDIWVGPVPLIKTEVAVFVAGMALLVRVG